MGQDNIMIWGEPEREITIHIVPKGMARMASVAYCGTPGSNMSGIYGINVLVAADSEYDVWVSGR